MTLRYGSVCSGIEAATVAWHPLGWDPAWFAEIEPFPSAVLAHRWPGVPNRGDFTTIEGEPGSIDLLVGGTPCQGFSVAGLRKGLADDRSNLALQFLRLADRLRPRWLVWENVPGVLSTNGGRDFGTFLGGLAELGFGWAFRILDAQHFGVPQRRRRVFLVGHLGDWRRAAAVLFERESLQGNPSPGREAGSRVASSLTASSGRRNGQPGKWGEVRDNLIPGVAYPLTHHHGRNDREENYVTYSLTSRWDAGEDGTGRGTPLVPVTFDWQQGGTHPTRPPTMNMVVDGTNAIGSTRVPAVAFTVNTAESTARKDHARESATARCLDSNGSFAAQQGGTVVQESMAVRRLTPREAERLQGFPDDWTLIPWKGKPAAQCPDGPRYKSLGNSFAVPVVRWIGRRIQLVEDHFS